MFPPLLTNYQNNQTTCPFQSPHKFDRFQGQMQKTFSHSVAQRKDTCLHLSECKYPDSLYNTSHSFRNRTSVFILLNWNFEHTQPHLFCFFFLLNLKIG